MLCLGDSYTIGETVEEADRFPNQTILALHSKGIYFEKPRIIATTGWTTDELMAAIQKENIITTYDFVTLLIGVNNQYRELSIDDYSNDFEFLLRKATHFAGEKKDNVIVLSIPDWAVTPFAKKRDAKKITTEIDAYNKINRTITERYKIKYLDITPNSRLAKEDSSLIAKDGLHPSGKTYAEWAKMLAALIQKMVKA